MISKSGQSSHQRSPCSADAGFDRSDVSAFAMRVDFSHYQAEVPRHRHRQGQIIMALHGAVTCTTDDAMWIVPPGFAVWVPGGVPHSNQATPNACLAYLFVDPVAVTLPERCCTLAVSAMLREMILRLADIPDRYSPDDHVRRLVRVLLDELAVMPRAATGLPVSSHPKVAVVAAALVARPDDRRTIAEWASHLAMSERSFQRVMVRETGLTFGQWRQQLHLIVALRELARGVSVQRVSGDLGYESATAFIVMFKKALGTTPTRYFASLSGRRR